MLWFFFQTRTLNAWSVMLQQQVATEIPQSGRFTLLLMLHCAY